MTDRKPDRSYQVELEICDDEFPANRVIARLTGGLDVEQVSGPDLGPSNCWPSYTFRGDPADLQVMVIRWHADGEDGLDNDLLADLAPELLDALRTWIGPVGPVVDRSDGYTLSVELHRLAESLDRVQFHLNPHQTGHSTVQRPDLLRRDVRGVLDSLREIADEVR